MASNRHWGYEETILALSLLREGSPSEPDIAGLAVLLNRSRRSVAYKLGNLRWVLTDGVHSFPHGSTTDERVVHDFEGRDEELSGRASAIRRLLALKAGEGIRPLEYVLRVRDVVHGYVFLTKHERKVIDTPSFQRLRGIGQNDVAAWVYPSLNSTRFEHSLGTAAVAGRMAYNIVRGFHWPKYQERLGLGESDFRQVCRLYGLVHDIGHLPFSHLFDLAFKEFAGDDETHERLCAEWFGRSGFDKAHEAFGAKLIETLLEEAEVPPNLAAPVRRLMMNKELPADDPLEPIKKLIDSDLDADRIDATARDGAMAGGEYGNYDIDRLCGSVFVLPDSHGWRLAYSEKAIGPIEGLLLDRYRTHTWIHFHHRVVAIKAAARLLVAELLRAGSISRELFATSAGTSLISIDDAWLWALLRAANWGSGLNGAAWEALSWRSKKAVMPLWHGRGEWERAIVKLKSATGLSVLDKKDWSGRLDQAVSEKIGVQVRTFRPPFKPLDKVTVTLTDEGGELDRGDLTERSALAKSLPALWAAEPQFHVIAFRPDTDKREDLRGRWIDGAAECLRPRSRTRSRASM